MTQRKKVDQARETARKLKVAKAREMKAKGYTNVYIGEQLGVSESTVRRLLKASP